jgi:tetratricopeptide (TPR) repeat protein
MYIFLLLLLLLSLILKITFDKEKIAKSLKTLESIEQKASKQIDRINADEKKSGNNSGFLSKFKKKEKKIINAKLRANIIRAECNLLSAALYLFQENMISFVKAALCLKKVWSGYNSCWNEIKDDLEENKKIMDKHTFHGILFGIGSSKLLLSVLPPKVLSIISIFGITSDREQGMNLLNKCIEERNLYSSMALSAQLFYYSIFNSLAPATVSNDLEIGQKIIDKGLEMYPNSAIQLYFQGRFIRMIHNLETSTDAFIRGNEAQSYFPELNYLFQYELLLNVIFNQEWERGIEILNILIEKKYYSEIFFSFLAGLLYCMTNNIEKGKEYLKKSEDLYKSNQGKLIDIDQYCQNIIYRIKEDNYKDVEVAILEFMYFWDGIPCMDKRRLEMALQLRNNNNDNIKSNKQDSKNENDEDNVIEDSSPSKVKNCSSTTSLESKSTSKPSIEFDNFSSKNEIEKEYIYRLIIGSLYRELKCYEKSEDILKSIIHNKHHFSKKSYILPFANFELGLLYINTKDFIKAQKYFGKIKSYKGFFMEFRLDLKLQKANEYLKFLSEKKDEPSKNETIKSPYEIKENVSSNENIVENMSSKDEKQQI